MPASPEKLNLASMDVAADKQRLLRQLFPEAFTETTDEKGGDRLALDFDKLKAVLGVHGAMTEPGQERYGLDWPGKRDALRAVQAPSYGTLLPAPEESVDWENTKNVFIEGDNLEVLKLLQKSYYGKVKMIYIDPPYNTGNDFVYPDNYAESLETYLKYTGKIDDQGFKTTTNTKDSGRFHSNWLRMMYPRLYVAKNLLREDGVIFISIDDNTSDGTTAVRELFSAQYFDFPKPPELISMIADQASSMDDLVIDMFAGSGTGVHAIMALNAEDGGSRRCISVQLPEPCAESSEASRAGFKTIADIAKERIRRAGAKIRGEWKEKNAARETAHAQSEEKKAGDLFSESASLAASSHPPSPISNPFPPTPASASSSSRRPTSNAGTAKRRRFPKRRWSSKWKPAWITSPPARRRSPSCSRFCLKPAISSPARWRNLSWPGTRFMPSTATRFSSAWRTASTRSSSMPLRKSIRCSSSASTARCKGNDPLKVNTLETFRAAQPEIQFRTV